MAKGKKNKSGSDSDTIVSNKKALRDFIILEKFEAGIELKGTEVKSIRDGKMNLQDAFGRVENGQLFLHGCDIQPYERASHEQHLPRRPRRLLMHKKEIERLFSKSEIRGQTIIALRAYWKNRRVKIEIGLGKGKAQTDRREDLKKRVADREAQRAVANFNRRS
ncbi:MAG: SsrA-binding protein SmpB [Verrucomicrobiota bacterium]